MKGEFFISCWLLLFDAKLRQEGLSGFRASQSFQSGSDA
jgi:hypothetical protein